MAEKPTYEELEQRVKELEEENTEFKRVDVALQDSTEKHRSILENVEDGYFEVDIAGNFTFFNDSAAKSLGYSQDELMGMNSRQYTDEENAKKIYQTFNKVYATGKTHKGFDWEIIRKDGSKRSVEASVSLRKDSEGQPIGFRGIVRDVSERKQTEGKLRESEEVYRSLFKNNHSIMLLIDSENADIVDANSAAISYYGWSHEVLTGKKITDINILTKEKVFQEMERVKKEPQHFFFRHRLASGEIRDVEIYSGPITVYRKKLLYSIIHDITERVKTEQLLQKSEERFRTLFEKVPASIQGYGSDGIIHFWNKASENTYGYKKDDAIGKNIVELIIPPEMRGFMHDTIKKGTETGKMPQPEEFLMIRQNGSRVPVFSSQAVLKLEEEEPEFYCFSVDLTVQKKLQERLQQAQKMESISTLSGGIAHQFNNALSGITGNIDLLAMDFPDNETVANYTRAMKDSARRMMQLTAQLLAYARGGKFHAKTVLFSDFVKETLSLVKHTLGSDIDVDTDRLLGILNVKADLTQMQMVLSAVLTNAAEAMEGKGCIRVACKDTIIADETVEELPGLTPGNYVNLTIVDDGKGMDKQARTLIFEPFFTTKFTGRGLGMAAVYGIVKNHNGLISVESEPGKGTVVKIYLPAVEALVKKHSEPESKAEWIKGTGTILVIEDEEPVMKISRVILERLGYRVLEARTGQGAIDIAKTFDNHIDLALLDILLPDMSGNDIYPLIMEARPDLKVIVFSGYSIDGPAREILDAGAENFIQKPLTIAALSEKLKETLEGGQ
ncbi:MAG: PAS domain S-box protein [Thermodesulfobacteriota bacterium]|nr:PAS domain S-box protein [Thermodesulfobacteriota bacterium]